MFICLFSTVIEIAVVECVGFCSNVDAVSFDLQYDTVSHSRWTDTLGKLHLFPSEIWTGSTCEVRCVLCHLSPSVLGSVLIWDTNYTITSCLHRASIISKHFLLFQLKHTIIKSRKC